MTDRLYYTDPYLQAFDARVVRVDVRDDGRMRVVLDRTAFYPTSGGQPFDVGVIIDESFTVGGSFQDRLAVVDVVDDDNGEVVHVVDASADALTAGQTVRGAIDWVRRFDHMQQHTGQHVLSAAIDRLFGVRTVSFHLGAESSTIDVSRELKREEIVSAEVEANRIVWENRTVSIRFASADEAVRLPLRKESGREGTLRLIDVENFDLSACGGTHVSRTGGIGVIAIGSIERFKGGQRVEFFCGARALTKFRTTRDVLANVVRVVSVPSDELPNAIEKLQVDARDRQREMSALQLELARFRAAELAASGEPLPPGRLVAVALDTDANGLKAVASAIVSRPGLIAVLASTSSPSFVVVARSPDVAVAANQVIAALTAKYGGRGGGKPDLAQAGGLHAESADLLLYARAVVLG